MPMLASTATISCDRCDAATSRAERGWRGYRAGAREDEVIILCPECAERTCGEDEMADRA